MALLAASPAALGAAPAATTAVAASEAPGVETVLVTARRRAEDPQKTPVSVTALSSEQLQAAGVHSITDLTAVVPGVNFTGSGARVNTVYSIRGMSRGVIGNAQPAVATYVDDVPLSTWAANIPTYDVDNVQVLKGPQGTLFGRNTTAGAILVNTKQPTYNFNGYVQGTFGSYAWNQYEGALNIPIVDDMLAVRLAGQIARRDGYTKNMTYPGSDFDNLNGNAFRASVLFEPTPWLKNVTVYDYYSERTHGTGTLLYKWDSNPALPVNFTPYVDGTLLSIAPITLCGGLPICDVSAAAARQAAAGPRKEWNTLPPVEKAELWSLTNTTTVDAGFAQIKNIFGYRSVFVQNISNTSGYEASLIRADNLVHVSQLSDEFQVSGTSFDDTLTWIAGLFFLEAKPNGPNRLTIQQFAQPGTPLNAPYVGFTPFNGAIGNGDFYHDSSRAVYGQINYKLSGLFPVLEGVSIDAGLRYTKDRSSVCSIIAEQEANPASPESACTGVAPLSSRASASSSKLTYTFGLNYQANDNLLLYAVTRRGYRAGGINPPLLGGTLVPFQSYQPETVSDVEIGLKSNWQYEDMYGHFNVAAYRSNYDRVQAGITTGAAEQLPGGADGDFNPLNEPSNTTFYANVGKATVQGIELEGSISPVDGLMLTAAGAWLDKKIDSVSFAAPANWAALPAYTSADLASFAFLGSPSFSYTLGLDYTLPFDPQMGTVVFGTRFFQTSSMAFGTVRAPSWNKVDFRIDWSSIYGSPVDASFFVTNATDSVGVVGGSLTSQGLGLNSVIYNEPRMIGVQLRYHFGEE